MGPFVYQALPQRVVFGFGTLAGVAQEIDRLGCSRAIVLSTPQQEESARNLADAIGRLGAGVFAKAAMHTPTEITDEATAAVASMDADCIVSLGGGSTTGLGKAVALRTDLPQIVIPTTYAGSEATPILGETRNGRKTTQRSPKILPEIVIYDVELSLTLPPALSVTSGMNAIAHAVEARYTRDRNPVISLLALEAIRAMTDALPRIVAAPRDREARSDALYGAWAAGTCLGSVGMALHHKLCHVLGGSFDLPHAETHTVVLPHAVAYNERAAAELLAPIADILGASSTAGGLHALAQKLNAPTSLRQLGMPHDRLDRAADLAVADPYWNPRPIERDRIRLLLEDAWEGRAPRLD